MPTSGGERIRELRLGLRLSQRDLGVLLGVSRETIATWELGQAVPEVRHQRSLARRFGVEVESFGYERHRLVAGEGDLRQRRVAAGLSQADLAAKLGLTKAAISQWECGRTSPSPAQAKALRRLLG